LEMLGNEHLVVCIQKQMKENYNYVLRA